MTLRVPYLLLRDAYYPVVDVELIGPKTSLAVKALVDSGATYSIFREEIADSLGVNIESGQALYLEGVGGRILGYMQRLPVVIAGKRFQGKLVFSREYRVSVNIMGRDNLFEPFRVTFAERSRALELRPARGLR